MLDLSADEVITNNQLDSVRKNTVVVANIVEVITSVVKNLAGVDISETMNKENLTKNMVSLAVVNSLNNKIA
jgi:ribosomal protein L12E/L44/L45/RPP1/RPP2